MKDDQKLFDACVTYLHERGGKVIDGPSAALTRKTGYYYGNAIPLSDSTPGHDLWEAIVKMEGSKASYAARVELERILNGKPEIATKDDRPLFYACTRYLTRKGWRMTDKGDCWLFKNPELPPLFVIAVPKYPASAGGLYISKTPGSYLLELIRNTAKLYGKRQEQET